MADTEITKPVQKFCVDCKWCAIDRGPQYARCLHSKNQQPNADRFVFPEAPAVVSRLEYCATVRNSEASCGPEARWFEPKAIHAAETEAGHE